MIKKLNKKQTQKNPTTNPKNNNGFSIFYNSSHLSICMFYVYR